MQRWQRWLIASIGTGIIAPLAVLIIWDYIVLRREIRDIKARDEVQWVMFQDRDRKLDQVIIDTEVNKRLIQLLMSGEGVVKSATPSGYGEKATLPDPPKPEEGQRETKQYMQEQMQMYAPAMRK